MIEREGFYHLVNSWGENMNEQFLEIARVLSGNYYLNFASCLIVPSLILLVFLSYFSMLAGNLRFSIGWLL